MRIRYWLREGLKITFIVLVACLVYTVLMALQDDDLTGKELFALAGTFTILFGALFSMVFCTTLYNLHFPLVLSFGSTRKEVLLGLHCYRIIYTSVFVIMTAILFHLAGADKSVSTGTMVLFSTGAILFCHAAGSLLGVIYVRYGKLAMGIAIAVGIAAFIAAVIGIVLAVRSGFTPPDNIDRIIPVIGVLAYALVSIPEVKTIQRYNVKL